MGVLALGSCGSASCTRPRESGWLTNPQTLSDHLGRLEEERRRKRQPESLSGAEVEDELELYGPLHREVGRFGALQDLVYVVGGAPKQVSQSRSIRQEPAG